MKKKKMKHLARMICIIAVLMIGTLGYFSAKAADSTPTYYFNYNSSQVEENSEIELKSTSDQIYVYYKSSSSGTGMIASGVTVTWSSSAEEVATVTIPNSSSPMIAQLNRIGPGYSNITATVTDSSGTYILSCKVLVDYAIDTTGTGFKEITTTKERALVFSDVGSANSVDVNLYYTNASTSSISDNASVTWYSSDENVVTCDGGTITPVGAGMTTVTVKSNSVSQSVDPLERSFKVIVAPKAVNPDGSTSDYLSSFTITYDSDSDKDIKTNAVYTTNLDWVFYDSDNNEIDPTDVIDYTLNENSYININSAKAGTYYIRAYVSSSYTPADFSATSTVPYLTIELVVPVSFDDTSVVMNVGDTYDIYDNSNLPSATTFNYTSSDSSIAEVDNYGVITAVSQGTTTIKLTNSSESYTITVTVIDGISLNYTSVKIYTAGTVTLKATTTSSNTVTWSTSKSSVATVTNGVVTGVAKGTAVITATQTVDGVVKKATCTVYVQETVTSITISPSSATIDVDAYKTLTAVVSPSGLSGISLTWTTSDSSIVDITSTQDLTATVQGVAAGTAIITAINQENVVVGYCTVTVNEPVTKITLSDTSVTALLSKKTYQLTAYVTPDDATNQTINWSTTNKSIATVSSSGLVTFVKAGSVSIIATSDDDATITAICNFTIQVAASSLSLDDSSLTMSVGDAQKLGYTITPTSAADADITWSTSSSSVATVSSSGLVTAKKAGTAIIIAKTDGGLIDTCTITVVQDDTGLSLDTKSLELYVNKTYSFTVTVTPATATDYTLTWTSSDTTVATVDSKGKVTGKAAGKAIITVKSSNGNTAYCNVTVKAQVTGIQLNYTEKTIVIDETFKLKATVIPSSAADDVTFTWTTSNEKVATVSSAGTVTAVKGGTAVITCKTSDGSYTEYCIVTVVERVTSITLNKTSYKLGIGKTVTLKATVKSNAATSPTLKWTSSNSKIVTVNSKGQITGKALGTATIKAAATDDSGAYATCTVRVVKAVTSIKLNNTSVNTVEGRTFTLKATISPSDATFKTVTWSSSDEKIAIVDSSGTVTALAEGTVTIKASAKDNSGKTAACYVVVQKRTPSTSVTIINQNLTMVVGETTTVQKAINPTNSTDRYTWESDNKTVASVNASSGKVTANTPGIANVTVMTESGKTATTKITVVGLNTTSLTLEQYSTYQLYVVGLTSGVTWDVEDNEIATVSGGLVTSRRIGTTNITAMVNGRRLVCKLKVTKIQ